MMPFLTPLLLASLTNAFVLPRDSTQTCSNLRAQSNNGDRKIAIVIDASLSMLSSDPYDYRLVAGKSVVNWLIAKDETTSDKKQDLVTVIDFADEGQLDYPLGDPGNASSSIDAIVPWGATYIAGGVEMATQQLNADGTGATADRSGIVVFTDGEDSSTQLLIDQINNATSLGIRVSFGFLSSIYSLQDPGVLGAIMKSGGRYYTISDAQSSNNFINGIIVNGLTKKDNPDGDTTTLLAGLDSSHYISGSETQTMTYSARASEELTISVQSVDAGDLDVQIKSGSRTLASGTSSLYSTPFYVTSPGNGDIDVKVTAHEASKDSIFVVGVLSNLPAQNCTVGVGKPSNKTNVAEIVGSSVGAGILLIGTGVAYLLWKHCFPKKSSHGSSSHELVNDPGTGKPGPQVTLTAVPPTDKPSTSWLKKMFDFPEHAPSSPPVMLPPYPPPRHQAPDEKEQHYMDSQTDFDSGSEWEDVPDQDSGPSNPEDPVHPMGPNQAEQDPKKRRHIKRVRIYGNNHHHHVPSSHPCYTDTCPLVSGDRVCDDPDHPCTCVDPKCKLNSRRHSCEDEKAPLHKCPGPKQSPNCPLDDPEYAEKKQKEHHALVAKYMAQDAAKSGVWTAGRYAIKGLAF
ncbi:hypothetical protein BDV96DRAFT_679761 [Lophiotrema nucula]|uniref:VWFA domain-containing protein n=1 Tax=Lophiotrema nucula TaxID=690887 RepID=A0A6A5ZEF1_9PLEO|nr:hypothetical protein BDV96DRAFT_679761 [Lophiotrema nucula]